MAIILPRTFMSLLADVITVATAKTLTTRFITADDNLVTYAGTSWNTEKELRFVRNDSEMNSSTLIVKAEVMSSFGTTNIGFFLNSENIPRITLFTVGTGFELLEGTAYIGNLSNGVNSIKIKLQNLEYGTAFQRLIEIYDQI